jgi:peptidyl-prolyl cis-trans isomerase SurA
MTCLISILMFLTFPQQPRAEVIDRIVALVNTEVVTDSDLRAFSKKLKQNGMIDDLLLFGQKPDTLKNSKKDQLNYLINERLLESEIKRLNLSVTVEKVEQEIRDIAKRNHVSRNELLEAIKAQGMSVSEYQDFIKSRVERQSLIEQEVSSRVRVSDEDILAHYLRAHPNSNTGSFEYTLAHIVFNPQKGGMDKALTRAELALRKIKLGESFETVAEQFSEDSSFTPGGLLGTFRAGEFSKELEAAVQNLNAGQSSEIVKSRGVLHILKVLEKKVVADPAFEKDKEKIRGELFETAFQKNFRTWLEIKRDESFVRINLAEYK